MGFKKLINKKSILNVFTIACMMMISTSVCAQRSGSSTTTKGGGKGRPSGPEPTFPIPHRSPACPQAVTAESTDSYNFLLNFNRYAENVRIIFTREEETVALSYILSIEKGEQLYIDLYSKNADGFQVYINDCLVFSL